MRFPPVDLLYLRDQYREAATRLAELWDAAGPAADDLGSPRLLRDAMAQLVDLLRRAYDETAETELNLAELNTLGEYGQHLLDELGAIATALDQAAMAEDIERLSMPFALWIARHGGEIRNLEPVVNALAQLANSARDTQQMATLYSCCCELIEAASPSCEEPTNEEAQHPWRLLLINRAIVATRSHNPELMECAFDAIVEYLPADAPRFFTEGMEQIAVINYPEPVRELIHRYYLAQARPRSLH